MLIKCSECGRQISDKASACPNCGCPTKPVDYLPSSDIKINTGTRLSFCYNYRAPLIFIASAIPLLVMVMAFSGYMVNNGNSAAGELYNNREIVGEWSFTNSMDEGNLESAYIFNSDGTCSKLITAVTGLGIVILDYDGTYSTSDNTIFFNWELITTTSNGYLTGTKTRTDIPSDPNEDYTYSIDGNTFTIADGNEGKTNIYYKR